MMPTMLASTVLRNRREESGMKKVRFCGNPRVRMR